MYGNQFKRRTLLKVYAKQGEYILLGSSAIGVNSGDIFVFNPNRVGGLIGAEIIPTTPDLKCSSQVGRGRITNRTAELAGPTSIVGNNNPTGYIPCYYQAPTTGVYDIVMTGPMGLQANVDGLIPGDIGLSHIRNFNADQRTTVAAWDVTVRSSNTSSSDITGRLFAYYFSLFGGDIGRPLYISIYPITSDGFRYKMDLRGADAGGFLLYGNQVGFFNSDGKSPLYHDILGSGNEVNSPEGNTSFAPAQYPIFLNPVDLEVLNDLPRVAPDGTIESIGIPAIPTLPIVDQLKFIGTTNGNTSVQGTGGTFSFSTNTSGNYQITISHDGSSFDPTHPKNRVLRGIVPVAGAQTILWDGQDNSGNPFPTGNNHPAQVQIRAGEYHFPLIDVENNYYGGPTITLLNQTNPLGNTTAFYDDRGYRTLDGSIVGSINQVLCGGVPPNPSFSNPVTGFDTRGADRRFGRPNGGNTNQKCTGSFGDTKGLDLWTYFPSFITSTVLNIIPRLNGPSSNVLLIKRITKINNSTKTANGDDLATYIDETNNPYDDNQIDLPSDPIHPDTDKWPDPTTFLMGGINGGNVRSGDQLEYTIYFLSTGREMAHHVLLCDRIPENVRFLSTTFNSFPTAGLPTGDRGILALINGSTLAYTNVQDSDRATFFPPGDNPNTPYPKVNCGGENRNGAIVIDLGDLPKATAPGTPTGSYGFIRFRGQVK
jgi:uncharacterized repeat protein (TIGR01451 family)